MNTVQNERETLKGTVNEQKNKIDQLEDLVKRAREKTESTVKAMQDIENKYELSKSDYENQLSSLRSKLN